MSISSRSTIKIMMLQSSPVLQEKLMSHTSRLPSFGVFLCVGWDWMDILYNLCAGLGRRLMVATNRRAFCLMTEELTE